MEENLNQPDPNVEAPEEKEPVKGKDVLFSGEEKPEWYDKNKNKAAIKEIANAHKKTNLSDGGAIDHR